MNRLSLVFKVIKSSQVELLGIRGKEFVQNSEKTFFSAEIKTFVQTEKYNSDSKENRPKQRQQQLLQKFSHKQTNEP